ncbi:MAG: Gfo/Idh/MocA family oxidoreductase [Planctomycetales bacterium]|nr:Gfo/Idh/MocA family oxidoreductase [Planctomycetales bacterium]MBN8624433.1 Gfo/Idh/MocA family oxidoreductase [Planctomycetota bacterium]
MSTRREFLERSGVALAAASTMVHTSTPAQAAEGQSVTLASIGVGGQGSSLLKTFADMPDVKVAYVCDPDEARAAKAAESIKDKQSPQTLADLRRVLDDPKVDAVVVATPDHWHGPATLLALAAGKHVYVEKPCSHNIREGRLMVEAAERAKKVVQVGTQSRSTGYIRDIFAKLHGGIIGEIVVAKAWNSQRRKDIGHLQPSEAPAGFDHDLWIGPAPMQPFQANRQHYNWHWWYDFGTGDAGNDGVHELDVARWGLGVDGHPSRVAAIGGKYGFDDDQQFPDTLYTSFDYPGNGSVGQKKQLIFEMRIWSPYKQEGFDNGCAFYGREGMLLLGKNGGYKLFGPGSKLIEEQTGKVDTQAHRRNFIDCIYSGAKPNADILTGHVSATLCHLANIAARVGRSLEFDPAKEEIVGDVEAQKLVGRTYREGHWAVPKV